MATTLTTNLRLRIADTLDDDAKFNLNKIDSLSASGLFDATGNLTLRSATDIVLRPGGGNGGAFRSNQKLTSFQINSSTLLLNNDIAFSGSWQIPWTNISKSGASATDLPDFTTAVETDAHVAIGYNHTFLTSNPHATTASQVGAYTTGQTDTFLAGKAALVHSHVSSDITDFTSSLNSSSLASTLNSHIANGAIHFTEASINHTHIQNIGINTHAQIDSHIANNANPHAVTAAQVGSYTTAQSDANLLAHTSASTAHGTTSHIVGIADIQALTNKTLDAAQNTLTNISNSAISASAAIAGTKIAPDFGNQLINTDMGISFTTGGHKFTIIGPQSGLNTNFSMEFPGHDGTSGQILATNGSGVLQWANTLSSVLAQFNVYVGDVANTLTAVDTSSLGDIKASTTLGFKIQPGVITNSAIGAGAAIAYSKLALNNSILNADINSAAAIAYSKLSLTGNITNSDINAGAAIAYSKLSLSGSVLNADINGAAAIAYSKLALTGNIINADLNAAAAISYSKLALTGAIVNADINAAAAVAYSKLTLTNSIVNADINPVAAISYSKLALAGSVVNADIAAGAAVSLSKLVALPTNLAVISDNSGVLTTSSVTATELSYSSGVTGSIQTQLNALSAAAGTSFKATWALADGTTKTITHNLGTADIFAELYDIGTGATIIVDSQTRTSTNILTLTSSVAPSAAGWRVLIRST